jgi:FkbM family methyltransferase
VKLPSFPFLISRIRHHGVFGSLYAARDALAWWATHAVLRRAPWSRNRLGQRFQMLCFSDYRHMRNGNPEVRESLFTERVLRPGMTVVDVGANHGTFALEAASFVGEAGIVYAFEPTPKTRAQLEWHLRLNGVGNVKIFPFAVGESAGTAMLRIHESATGLNSLAPAAIHWEGQTVVADEILKVPLVTSPRISSMWTCSRLMSRASSSALYRELGDCSLRGA